MGYNKSKSISQVSPKQLVQLLEQSTNGTGILAVAGAQPGAPVGRRSGAPPMLGFRRRYPGWWALAMSWLADPNVEVTQTYPVGYSCSQMPCTSVLRTISRGHCEHSTLGCPLSAPGKSVPVFASTLPVYWRRAPRGGNRQDFQDPPNQGSLRAPEDSLGGPSSLRAVYDSRAV